MQSSGTKRSNKRQETSNYYIANEIRATYKGMDLVLEEIVRRPFQTMPPEEMARQLLEYSAHVRPSAFKRAPRGPKKPVPPRTKHTTKPHVSTFELLAEADMSQ